MKILITNTGPWGTGSFTVAHAVLQELVCLGHEVKLFFPDTGIPSKDLDYYYQNKDWFEIWKFPISDGTTYLESFPLIIPDPHPRSGETKTYKELTDKERMLFYQAAEKNLHPLLESFKPDIVECQHIWSLDAIVHEAGYPYICTAHHSDQMGFLYDKSMQSRCLDAAKNAKAIIAVSNFVKKEVLQLYGVPDNKVHVLTNGYNKTIFQPMDVNKEAALKMLDVPYKKDAYYVSFAGKLSKTKGIDILLLANKLLPKEENIHFLVLGAGDLSKALDQEKLTEYCYDRVHFLGHQTQPALAEIHNLSDLSILPSRSEGFGIACLEAMGCGVPVVVTRSGGMTDFAKGRIIPIENPKALADAVLEIKNLHQEEYRSLCFDALHTAQSFSWAEIAKKRVELYQDCLKKT